MGVRRAMGRVLEAASAPGGRLVTYGPLIHNSQVIQLLKEKNVGLVSCPEEILPGDRVAIRAHGVPPDTRQAIRQRGATLCDATCPHVARAQGLVKRSASRGYDVVIVGDRGHAEVVGLLGFARGRGHVVESVADVDRLPPLERVALVAQTTQSEELYRAVEARVRERFPSCEVHYTICGSTSDRQRETVELAQEVDVLVVVGGRHSANTVRLAEIARATGRPTVHVESVEELREDDFKGHSVVGVTAGASTPNWIIEEVVERLQGFQTAWMHPWVASARRGLNFFVRAGFLVALGAGGLAYASSRILGRPFEALHFIIPATYIFSMMNLNLVAECQAGEMGDPVRAALYRRHGRVLAGVSVVLAVLALALSAHLGPGAFAVIFLSALLGVLYTIRLFPEGSRLRYLRLKDLPGSKNIFFAGAVVVVTVVLPLLDGTVARANFPGIGIVVPALLVFALAFTRSVVLDVKDLQSDMFAGRETIPVLIGNGGTKVLLGAVLAAAAGTIVLGSLLEWVGPEALWQVLTMVLTCSFLFLYHLRRLAYGIVFHVILDASFALAGVVALVASRVGS
jgi:(E)-4-hydroxy-3-methyl-but-2-enyl pyrophosphate reductase